MRPFSLLIFSGWLAVTVSGVELRNDVVLRTDADGRTMVSDEAALAGQKFTPASTFKVFIAWVALEEGLVTPESRFLVGDQFVPGAPRELDLHEALYFSSNDYFDRLGKMLGREKLEQYLIRSGYAGGKPPQGWLDDMSAVERGGTLTVTPRENHQFMLKLARGRLASSAKIQGQLLQALRWPCRAADRGMYGKTGTAGGVLWFNGFSLKGNRCEVVTVLGLGAPELRLRIIGAFYETFREQFDSAKWLRKYPADHGAQSE